MHKTFLSCDWGTSSFRLRLIDITTGEKLGESVSDDGISWMYKRWKSTGRPEKMRMNFYLAVIKRHIKKIGQQLPAMEDDAPVIVSGMASSSIGMLELPYTILPFAVSGKNIEIFSIAKTDFFSRALHIISGARTKNDVMRGEETQLMGCAGAAINDKQFFIFPGTHSKHVETKRGEAIDLKTYMTGEIFSLMLEHSILAASIAFSSDVDEQENNTAFEHGVKNGAMKSLSHALFTVRTNDLLQRFSKAANYYYLSGLLIGAELANLSKEDIAGITIVGDQKLIPNYLLALKILGTDIPVSTTDAVTATMQGQLIVYKQLYGANSRARTT